MQSKLKLLTIILTLGIGTTNASLVRLTAQRSGLVQPVLAAGMQRGQVRLVHNPNLGPDGKSQKKEESLANKRSNDEYLTGLLYITLGAVFRNPLLMGYGFSKMLNSEKNFEASKVKDLESTKEIKIKEKDKE